MTTDTRTVATFVASSEQRVFSALSPAFLFSILSAISFAVWCRSLAATFDLALHDDQSTHILLILPVTVTLIFLDWKSTAPGIARKFSLLSVLALITIFAAAIVPLRLLALPSDLQLSLDVLLLVLWWIVSFALCFGHRAFQRSIFPLCLLLWMVPLPNFVLDPIVLGLQRGSAAAARLLFSAAGVQVAQKGVLLHISGLTLEVARECSSMRSSCMLMIITMVLAHQLLRSPWRRATLILLAIPLSIAKNGFRIFAIAMLATRVDRGFLTGRLHRQGGIIFLLIALAAISLLLWILRHGEEPRDGIEQNPQRA